MILYLYSACSREASRNKLGLLIADNWIGLETGEHLFQRWDGRPPTERTPSQCCRVASSHVANDYADVWRILLGVVAPNRLDIRRPDGSPAIYSEAYCNRRNDWLPGYSVTEVHCGYYLRGVDAKNAVFSRITVIDANGRPLRL